MNSISAWVVLGLLAALVGGVVAYRLRRAPRGTVATAANDSQMQWRQSQMEPDTQAGRI
jgi:hypothetical protein